jgi:RHS repeat-associated protein
LVQWNIWGLDNVGKINADTTRNYYLKDHLGSIRVVLNSTNQVISAQDYDAWGYPLENRTYNATAMKYDFTGKERDDQTTYDYFGARYYDSRIANWTSIDPLFEKHLDHSPYNYVLRNPIRLIDPDGRQVQVIGGLIAAAEAAIITTASVMIAYEVADYFSDVYVRNKSEESITFDESFESTDNNDITNPYVESKGGKKRVWPEGFINQKPRNWEDIDWSKGDQQLADQITGKDAPHGPKTPNNEIKKWFNRHRPKTNSPIVPPDTEDKSTRAKDSKRAKSVRKD